MDVIARARTSAFHVVKRAGGFEAIASSAWRRARLLVLCYHGVSLGDEHRWRPALYVSPQRLAERLQAIRGGGYSVLPLGDALRLLYRGDLPERTVVLTFDDGGHDFHASAYPLLQENGYPATVYLRTDYCGHGYPVFLLMLSYLLWKAAGVDTTMPLPTGPALRLDTRTPNGRARTGDAIRSYAKSEALSLSTRDELLARLAQALDIDYGSLRSQRLLQIMSPEEVSRLSRNGIDFQLHTHGHHSPRSEAEYRLQITQNRRRIQEITGQTPTHFCYPSGEHAAEFLPWLRAEGVVSATTCVPGIARPSDNPLLLPRFVDTTPRSSIDFEAWLSGAGALAARAPRYNV